LQFGVGWNLGLVEQDRLVRIDPAGHQRGSHFKGILAQFGRNVRHRNGVQVGQEVEALATAGCHFVLHLHPIADRPQVIAEVKVARRLDAGNDTHGGLLYF